MTSQRTWSRLNAPRLIDRRTTRLTALLLLTLATWAGNAGAQLADEMSGEPSGCEASRAEAASWTLRFTESHRRLPEYSEIIELSRSVARWVVLALPPQEQHAFWQTHMEAFLTEPLSAAERHALGRASELLSLEIFERAEKDGWPAVAVDIGHIHAILGSAFDRGELAEIVSLGSAARSSGASTAVNNCGCNTFLAGECEGWPLWVCVEEYEDCRWLPSGCGPWFSSQCDGDCCRDWFPGAC